MNQITKDLNAKIGTFLNIFILKNFKACKCEFLNPGLSVKDRAAKSMIEAAEQKALITPEKSILIELTSGNLGFY